MKFRNKKTGEIIELELGNYKNPTEAIILVVNHEPKYRYETLAELNAEWEDVPEEPKEYWCIEYCGEVSKESDDGMEVDEACKEIGNYFKTEKEAEQAVEKLKAWERLKDKGLKISAKIYQDSFAKKYICLEANWGVLDGDYSDVLICFGGKE